MSANINFAVTNSSASSAAAAKKEAKAPAVVILPYDILNNLQGRRVTVLLSTQNEELEGTLRTVDDDRGDLFLEDVVHYVWEPTATKAAAATSTDGAAAGAAAGESGEKEEATMSGMRPCAVGGGARRATRRCDAAMVNSRFIDLVTPTLFGNGMEESVPVDGAAAGKAA